MVVSLSLSSLSEARRGGSPVAVAAGRGGSDGRGSSGGDKMPCLLWDVVVLCFWFGGSVNYSIISYSGREWMLWCVGDLWDLKNDGLYTINN